MRTLITRDELCNMIIKRAEARGVRIDPPYISREPDASNGANWSRVPDSLSPVRGGDDIVHAIARELGDKYDVNWPSMPA